MSEVRIVPIHPSHRAVIKRFDCGEESLNTYLKRFAERHSLKDQVSKTYLALVELGEGRQEVGGYHSVSACSVDAALVASNEHLARLPRFPVPGILLARLATSVHLRGQSLGRLLFAHALGLAIRTSDEIGARLLVVDALTPEAQSFYEAMGMIVLDPASAAAFPRRMVVDLHTLPRGI